MNKDITNEEASKILEAELINHLATSTSRYEGRRVAKTGSPFKIMLDEHIKHIISYWDKYVEYKTQSEKLGAEGNADDSKVYARASELTKRLMDDQILSGSIADQKKLYERDLNIFNSRSYTEFPYMLEGVGEVAIVGLYYNEISSIANNMGSVLYTLVNLDRPQPELARYIMETLGYDKDFIERIMNSDNKLKTYITEFSGKDQVNNFCNLEKYEDKVQFIKDHTKITHISCMCLDERLCWEKSIVWCPKGNTDPNFINENHVFKTYADVLANKDYFLNGEELVKG